MVESYNICPHPHSFCKPTESRQQACFISIRAPYETQKDRSLILKSIQLSNLMLNLEIAHISLNLTKTMS